MVRLKGIKVRVVPSGPFNFILSKYSLEPILASFIACFIYGLKQLPVLSNSIPEPALV